MNIGQVASKAGVAPATVRYYEQRGLLARATRTESGYRQYGAETINRLRFIKEAQRIGFTLQDIRELLDLHSDGVEACPQVQSRATQKIEIIKDRIRELTKMQRLLESLITSCDASSDAAECPLLASLTAEVVAD
jgi:MerR family transcriptional regulator, copper efflux regulator